MLGDKILGVVLIVGAEPANSILLGNPWTRHPAESTAYGRRLRLRIVGIVCTEVPRMLKSLSSIPCTLAERGIGEVKGKRGICVFPCGDLGRRVRL
jgi:hypothetical protein